MKAGTAQKMVLNMITTGAMTRLGYVFGNLMVNVKLKNSKLAERGITILQHAAKISRPEAERALKAGGKSVPTAMVMLQSGVSRAEAEKALKKTYGHVRNAITLAKS
jgi:N-acetylmuramic acid 6-phosphate etherase